MREIGRRIDLTRLILILSVSAVIAYGYVNRVDRPNFESRLELHSQIIAGTAPSPYRYRVLVPLIAEGFTKALSVVFPLKASFLLAYAMYDLLAVCSLLVTLFFWLRTWFSGDQSLIGVLFVAGTMPIALQDHYFQPWSLLEAGLFTAALLAIHRQRIWLLVSLVVLASLNRETAVFIPISFLLTIQLRTILPPRRREEWMPILLFGGLSLIWAAAFFGLRCILGGISLFGVIGGLLEFNTTRGSLLYTFVNGSLFLGGFWIFTLMGLKYAPTYLKRIVLVVPFYVITVMIWGVWYEVRLLMPLYPVLVALGLSFLYLRKPTEQPANNLQLA